MPISQEQARQMASRLPGMGSDPASVRRRIEAMEQLLEGLFVVPGTQQRVGLDAIIGLIPIAGDLITTAMGAWIVWEARNLGMPRWQIARMAANVGIDSVIGIIPFVGDALDFFFRSNSKNVKIIKKYLDKHHPGTVTIEA